MDDLENLILPTIDDLEAAKIITCTIVGIVEESDLVGILEGAVPDDGQPPAPKPVPVDTSPKVLREKHHSVARLVAQGLTQDLVAELSGYTPSYLSTLLGSPSMAELVSFYRAQNGNAAEVIGENLRRVGGIAVAKLEAKLDGDLDVSELVSIAKLGLDRSGHGPTQKVDHNHQHTVVAPDHLEQLNAQARSASRQRILPRPTPILDNDTGIEVAP